MKHRDRAWRRHVQDKKVIKRIKNYSRIRWWRFTDACGIMIVDPKWMDYIGTSYANFYKNSSTTKWDTRYKMKWGKKGNIKYHWTSDYMTRTKDKKRSYKELQSYGFKHLPSRLERELED